MNQRELALVDRGLARNKKNLQQELQKPKSIRNPEKVKDYQNRINNLKEWKS
jgi:hypothetical protein